MPDVVLLLVLCDFCKSDIDPFDLGRQRMSTNDLGAETSQVFAQHFLPTSITLAFQVNLQFSNKKNCAQVTNITK
jgi:hypothetical protein